MEACMSSSVHTRIEHSVERSIERSVERSIEHSVEYSIKRSIERSCLRAHAVICLACHNAGETGHCAVAMVLSARDVEFKSWAPPWIVGQAATLNQLYGHRGSKAEWAYGLLTGVPDWRARPLGHSYVGHNYTGHNQLVHQALGPQLCRP